MPNAMTYIKLEAALKKEGCPLCNIAHETSTRYLESILYENVNDYETRNMLLSSWGFCQRHTWQLLSFTEYNLGIAIINESIIDQAVEALSNFSFSKNEGAPVSIFGRSKNKPAAKLVKMLQPTLPCPACHIEKEGVITALEELIYQLVNRDRTISNLYRQSSGLCWPHFCSALTKIETTEALQVLIEIQIEKMQSLQAELKEFMRKNDYRYAAEPWGTERNAWIRSLAMLAGNKKNRE